MPYKQGVTGSSPVVPTKFLIVCGAVVQLVRTPACHAGGRGFKSLPRRHFSSISLYAQVAQLVEQWTENPRVAGSIPALGTICECSSSGRAPPCQGGGSEFEPRHSLHLKESACFQVLSLFFISLGPTAFTCQHGAPPCNQRRGVFERVSV